ncbi:hypothetical protein T439DRAFT_206918 [Meredithblackwellia eburnea MCA 4105]
MTTPTNTGTSRRSMSFSYTLPNRLSFGSSKSGPQTPPATSPLSDIFPPTPPHIPTTPTHNQPRRTSLSAPTSPKLAATEIMDDNPATPKASTSPSAWASQATNALFSKVSTTSSTQLKRPGINNSRLSPSKSIFVVPLPTPPATATSANFHLPEVEKPDGSESEVLLPVSNSRKRTGQSPAGHRKGSLSAGSSPRKAHFGPLVLPPNLSSSAFTPPASSSFHPQQHQRTSSSHSSGDFTANGFSIQTSTNGRRPSTVSASSRTSGQGSRSSTASRVPNGNGYYTSQGGSFSGASTASTDGSGAGGPSRFRMVLQRAGGRRAGGVPQSQARSKVRQGNVGLEEDLEMRDGEETDEDDFFMQLQGPAKVEKQWYSNLSTKDSPYWMSYSNAAHNWDALLTASLFMTTGNGAPAFLPVRSQDGTPGLPARPPARRVLDIGSGFSAMWCVEMALQPGWEETEFYPLDIGPSNILLELLPPQVAARITYTRHNFLAKLPFPNDTFDYVRLAHVSQGLPENELGAILDEVSRVLTSKGLIEILDSDLTVIRKHPALPPLTPPHSMSSIPHADPESDPFAVIDECFDAVTESRFINPHILGMIPSSLSLNFRNVQSSGTLELEMPALPPTNTALAPPTIPVLTCNPYRSVELQKRKQPQSSEMSRIFLHAYAERFAGSSERLAEAAAERRRARQKPTQPAALDSTPKPQASNEEKVKLEHELNNAVQNWCTDLKERAGLARLMESRLGWTCAFDEEMETVLSSYLPLFEKRINEYDSFFDNMDFFVGVAH